ncbi:hypothetical protein LINPERHAP1_LOCUS1770 [Linum perenne]
MCIFKEVVTSSYNGSGLVERSFPPMYHSAICIRKLREVPDFIPSLTLMHACINYISERNVMNTVNKQFNSRNWYKQDII